MRACVDDPILALDVARLYGWAEGRPGELPLSGWGEFARSGSSQEAVGWRAICWARERFNPAHPNGKRFRLILCEEPLPSNFARGNTNKQTTMQLMGLVYLLGAMAHGFGQHNFRVASPKDIRKFFLNTPRNLPGQEAKRLVAARCRRLGWVGRDVPFDQTDALAAWAYACELVEPGSMLNTEPLFAGL
jgi:hypothetical protein